jgi:hypothetical protein
MSYDRAARRACKIVAKGKALAMIVATFSGLKGRDVLVPNIAFIHLKTRFKHQCPQFILKTHLLVMFLLRLDVARNPFNFCSPDGERSVTRLPGKFRQPLSFQPFRRTRLGLLHRLRHCHRARKPHQQMNVIFGRTNLEKRAPDIAQHTTEVWKQGRSNFARQVRTAVPRAVHDMNENIGKRLRHGCRYILSRPFRAQD